MSRPAVVITGCARSGTGYGSAVLNACGFRCEHETLFSPYTTRFAGFGDVDAESSWLAAPFLDQLPGDTVVIHHVRRPHDVVRSLLGIGYFAEDEGSARRDLTSLVQVLRSRGVLGSVRRGLSPERWRRGRRLRSDFVDFLRCHCPQAYEPDDPIDRAWRYWVDWNLLVERGAEDAGLTYLRHRVEDGPTTDLLDLMDRLCPDDDREEIERAVRSVPTDTNTRVRRDHPVRIPDDSALRGEADALATRYGYDLGDLGG